MLLFELDRKNYSETNSRIFREAVRAIIPADGRLALVKSDKYGFYKFPGGGINEGETHVSALLRETKEETGLSLLPARSGFRKVRKSEDASTMTSKSSIMFLIIILRKRVRASPRRIWTIMKSLGTIAWNMRRPKRLTG